MAELIPINFRSSGDAAVISYNYTDVADGTGIIVYYPAKGTDTNILTTQTIPSNTTLTEGDVSDTNNVFTKAIDLDFDVQFNQQQTITGTALFSVTHAISTNTNGKTGSAYVIIKVRKWDGTTETDISNNQSDTITNAGTGAWTDATNETELVEVELTETLFKAGETLRITVEGWGKTGDAATAAWIGVGHDPANRDGSDDSPTHELFITGDRTILEAHIPFKLDL